MKSIVIVFAIAASLLLLVFARAEQHAEKSTIQRLCVDKAGVINRVNLTLTKPEPVGQASKRPFIIAAKLIFLVPQKDAETIPDYIARLTRHLDKVC